MREIIFDTETTGLDNKADRIIEIGAVELDNRFPTGRTYHVFINPEGRQVHPDALAVHGISNEMLADKPRFAEIIEDWFAFISDAKLIAHNANFDVGFFNAEFARLGFPPIDAARVIDSLALARRRHPMGPNSLDALCQRYGIDNSHRTKHDDQRADHQQDQRERRDAGLVGGRVDQVVDAERTEIGQRRDQQRTPVDGQRHIDEGGDQHGQHHHRAGARFDLAEHHVLACRHVESSQALFQQRKHFLNFPEAIKTPFIIGIAGSVAVGKSTTARVLKELLARWPSSPKVALVTTDGFLLPNAELRKRGLMERKGFPESYDVATILKFLSAIKAGEGKVSAPLYSHLTYDVRQGEYLTIDRPDILIFEGINVLQVRDLPEDGRTIPFVSDFFDFSIYIDADETMP